MPEPHAKFITTLHLELRPEDDPEAVAEDWIREIVADAQRHLYEGESCKVVQVRRVDNFPEDSFYE